MTPGSATWYVRLLSTVASRRRRAKYRFSCATAESMSSYCSRANTIFCRSSPAFRQACSVQAALIFAAPPEGQLATLQPACCIEAAHAAMRPALMYRRRPDDDDGPLATCRYALLLRLASAAAAG